MDRYHQRRPEQTIEDWAKQLDIIQNGTHLTMAMAVGDEPYLATVNYGFDADANTFYFHCNPKGKKVDFLRQNPVVWGQILDDRGYVDGRCLHGFRTVQFRGTIGKAAFR